MMVRNTNGEAVWVTDTTTVSFTDEAFARFTSRNPGAENVFRVTTVGYHGQNFAKSTVRERDGEAVVVSFKAEDVAAVLRVKRVGGKVAGHVVKHTVAR